MNLIYIYTYYVRVNFHLKYEFVIIIFGKGRDIDQLLLQTKFGNESIFQSKYHRDFRGTQLAKDHDLN